MIVPINSKQSLVDLICGLVKGKDVLDVGCVQHTADWETSDSWLHKKICNAARSVLGLDLEEAEVKKLQDKGYSMIAGDAITIDIGRQFDVIVAGEIIEHIDNAGLLLQNLKRHLTPDGLLTITTPNVFFPLHFVESIFCSPYKTWNSQHVQWYCYFTLENLLKRNGYDVIDCHYVTRSRKIQSIMRLLHLPCYSFLASTLLITCRKTEV